MVMLAEDAKDLANRVPQVENKKIAMIGNEIKRSAESVSLGGCNG